MWILKVSIYKFISFLNFLIIARALASWFVRDFSNPIFRILYNLTEPILSPFRNLLYRLGIEGAIDFSPLLAIVALDFFARFVITIL
ncbi:YggT family protein [Caminicella sporogenes DSM 14501]|uniref:YggT family protein n=2 Tax=Caminicella TaxID=166484 RepID=A0A1M6LJI9_9FIRM|nr:YggT family protein [Caminicella sporogenes]RKD27852.1 hypothetical protein BET04_01950 [Caminicella sporogenes]WIF94566.1 YggT family protein [Caminicella sporogenes]SHJ71377.1 YggT family protein [Caminicella sporogenes DSM 14501]